MSARPALEWRDEGADDLVIRRKRSPGAQVRGRGAVGRDPKSSVTRTSPLPKGDWERSARERRRGSDGVFDGRHAMRQASRMTGFSNRPIESISTATTSPSARNTGGVFRNPTPAGVPNAITSPGLSVQKEEQ